MRARRVAAATIRRLAWLTVGQLTLTQQRLLGTTLPGWAWVEDLRGMEVLMWWSLCL